jgi:hypothetical protein
MNVALLGADAPLEDAVVANGVVEVLEDPQPARVVKATTNPSRTPPRQVRIRSSQNYANPQARSRASTAGPGDASSAQRSPDTRWPDSEKRSSEACEPAITLALPVVVGLASTTRCSSRSAVVPGAPNCRWPDPERLDTKARRLLRRGVGLPCAGGRRPVGGDRSGLMGRIRRARGVRHVPVHLQASCRLHPTEARCTSPSLEPATRDGR